MALPPLISDLQLGVRGNTGTWQDTSASTAATATNDAVARWDDIRGYNGAGIYLVQGTSGSRPTLQTNQINSQPCVRFDGSNDFFFFSHLMIPALRTYYAWLKVPDSGDYTVICGDDDSLEWVMHTNKQRLVQSFIADIGVGSNTFANNTWFQVNATWDGSNGVFRLNQASDGSVSLSNVAYGPILGVGQNFHTIHPAMTTPAYTNEFKTDIACVLIYYGIHNTSQRQSVESWGAGEFGV